MLSLIQQVGEKLIHAEINQSLSDNDRAHDLFLDAYNMAFNSGLDACLSDKTNKDDVFLIHYPEFEKPWNDGYNEGIDRIARNGCEYCQDPAYHTCPYHG